MRTHWLALGALSMLGCRDKADETGTPPAEESREVTLEVYGQAPWDPMVAGYDDSDEIVAAEVNGTPLGEELSTVEGTYAFRDDLAEGLYGVTHPDSTDDTALEHAVVPYGRGEGFDATAIVGVPFSMDLSSPWIPAPAGLGDVMLGLAEGVWVEVISVEGDEAVFEVYTQAEPATTYPICRALRARGTLSATGELTWSAAALDIDDDTPLLRDLSIRAGWLEDGSQLGGVEGTATLHTAAISSQLVDDGVLKSGDTPEGTLCELLMGFGVGCYDCLGDGAYCMDLAFHAAVMSPWDQEIPEDPPSCGIDTADLGGSGPIGPIECELPDFSCAASFFGLLGLTGMLRRRRQE